MRSCQTVFSLIPALLPLVVAQNSYPQPNVLFRWSGQVALGNSPTGGNSTSTLYYYGGEAITESGQTSSSSGLWTNALVSIDLSTDWATGSPPIKLVMADTGNFADPPAVALGALWASSDGSKLYQYGGEFSDNPSVAPPAQAMWMYNIASNNWSTIPTTGDTITRAAEGSTAVVPGLGQGGDNMAYYFSGHEDTHTTQGWSNQIARIYLDSLVQFDLGSHAVTNITNYASDALTSNSSTPEPTPVYRADGTLTYVPSLGTNSKGLLVAIGGATSSQYIDNSVLDVYDIGAGGWTKQSTLGDTIGTRVNHCAVRASAKVKGVETHQIFIYGGQQLNQSSRDSALYILTIPSYTWSYVGGLASDSLPGEPVGRAGHQCALHGSQLVVIGGLLATNVVADQPGVYVYDVSSSAWQNSFTSNTIYSTPALVSNITGGIGTGSSESGAGSASGGDGSSSPDTSSSDTGNSGSGDGNSGGGNLNPGEKKKKSNTGAIVGGVVGGLLVLIILALLGLWWMRRRRRQVRKQEGAGVESENDVAGFPYEKTTSRVGTANGTHSPSSGWRSSNEHYASDDVEDETRGMEAAMSGSHLVPKRTLRVVNPEIRGNEGEDIEDLH